MPAERVSMRRVREILRLKYRVRRLRPGDRALAVGVARSTVAAVPGRAAAAGLSWPLPATLTDKALEALLFAARRLGSRASGARRSRTGRRSIASCAGRA